MKSGIRKIAVTAASAALVLIVAASGAGFAAQDATQARIDRVENGLRSVVPIKGEPGRNILERMEALAIPGVSVAVISDYKVAWAKGYGVMDVETKLPVTEKTLFVAGSVSKPIAAMGALRLVQEGKLRLDADINDALRSWKLPDNAFTKTKKATPRLLMSHNAGTTVHGFRGYAAGEPVPTLRQILDGEPPANSAPIRVDLEPGKLWRYSGGGVTIMQQALIDVEKKPFPEILREKVLAPIGMTSSSYEQSFSPERLPFASSGHTADGKVIEGKRFIYPEMAAAGLWTTPTDLAKAAIELQLSIQGKSNKVLNKETARLMVTPRVKISADQDMALGFFLEKNGAYFGHGGADIGYICSLVAGVEGGNGVVVMTNSEGRAGELIGEITRGVAQEYGWKGYAPEPVEVVTLAADSLKPFEGRFKLDSDNVLTVKIKGAALTGNETGAPAFDLLPVSPTEFVRRDQPVRYVFDSSGRLVIRRGSADFKVERLAAGESVPLERLMVGRFDEAVDLYRKIRAANPKDAAVAETRLNTIGYQIMARKLYAPAVKIFELAVEFYPESWNAYDSLAEGLAANGDVAGAIKNYEKSIALNPKNVAGAAKLEKLKEKR
jgi:CubicO group peptidase (beta-lactamase class C family)